MIALEKRLLKFYVDADSGCWVWWGATTRGNYPMVRRGERMWYSYREMYEAVVGAIPEGHDLDHLCRNHRCVNPAHLEPVTRRENVMRGLGRAVVNAAKTECVHGHPFSGTNLIVRRRPDGRERRDCRTCRSGGNG